MATFPVHARERATHDRDLAMPDAPSWPPGWFPDPTGRHDHRWWDGAAWTDHVADAGVAGLDALPPAPGPAVAPGATAPLPGPATGRTPVATSGTDPLAVLSLLVGLLGLILMFAPVIGLAAPIAAVVLGLVARSRLRRSGRGGRGLAVSGIVIGGVGLALSLVVTVASIALLSDPDSELTMLFRDYLTCIETRDVEDCQRELEEQLPDVLRRAIG